MNNREMNGSDGKPDRSNMAALEKSFEMDIYICSHLYCVLMYMQLKKSICTIER